MILAVMHLASITEPKPPLTARPASSILVVETTKKLEEVATCVGAHF
jgi:hypothetical protein